MTQVFLSLGSNIEPQRHLRNAMLALRANFGELLQSPVYESIAVGFSGDNFLNLVVAIDTDTFTFDGTIHIRNTPDPGRDCLREGPMTFAVTQNRKYWRLQDMTACGGLTDYVDIYF